MNDGHTVPKITLPMEKGIDFQKKILKIFFKIALFLTIQVLFSNHHIKLDTTQNTYYKHIPLNFFIIKILFINKKF